MREQDEHIASNEPGYRVGVRTHIGLRRKRNEDFFGIDQTPHGLLVVVCDGMGGHAGGDRASRLAVEAFIQAVRDASEITERTLQRAVESANHRIVEESFAVESLRGMGTTLVAAIVHGPQAWVINIGDSRGYLLRDGALQRITTDHSVVGELVASGELTEEQAAVHPRRNVITRVLGLPEAIEPDFFRLTLAPGDEIVLSSDGLHGLVRDAEIASILLAHRLPEPACDALIDAALETGGTDNITVAIVKAVSDKDINGPTTDPGAPARSRRRRNENGGSSRMVMWLIVVLAIVGIAVWSMREFNAGAGSVASDSLHVITPDSLLLADSIPHSGDSLQGFTLDSVPRVDSASDLSGTFGKSHKNNDSARNNKASSRRRR